VLPGHNDCIAAQGAAAAAAAAVVAVAIPLVSFRSTQFASLSLSHRCACSCSPDPETAFNKLLENHIFQCEGAALIDAAEQAQQEQAQMVRDPCLPFPPHPPPPTPTHSPLLPAWCKYSHTLFSDRHCAAPHWIHAHLSLVVVPPPLCPTTPLSHHRSLGVGTPSARSCGLRMRACLHTAYQALTQVPTRSTGDSYPPVVNSLFGCRRHLAVWHCVPRPPSH
jgi:hypothetical protein